MIDKHKEKKKGMNQIAKKQTDLTVALEIKTQLGRRFEAMVGAHNFIGHDQGLTFRFKGCFTANVLDISLDPSDTYDLTFYQIKGTNVRRVKEVAGVYCDHLHQVFEQVTGLLTSL